MQVKPSSIFFHFVLVCYIYIYFFFFGFLKVLFLIQNMIICIYSKQVKFIKFYNLKIIIRISYTLFEFSKLYGTIFERLLSKNIDCKTTLLSFNNYKL